MTFLTKDIKEVRVLDAMDDMSEHLQLRTSYLLFKTHVIGCGPDSFPLIIGAHFAVSCAGGHFLASGVKKDHAGVPNWNG